MALTVAGPVGCKEGSKEGPGARERSASPTDRWRNCVVPRPSALLGKIYLDRRRNPTDFALFSTARATTSSLLQFVLPSGF
jgi:hypothetical protein